MLSLEDILKLPPNPTQEHLMSLGLLTPPVEPEPMAIVPPATVGTPLSAVTPRAPASAVKPMEPLAAPSGPEFTAPRSPESAPGLGVKPMVPPTLGFKGKMDLPTTSPGVAPGTSGFYRNLLERAEEAKAHPWGSPENHPGLLGKIGHIAARIGNIAGNVVAPGTMSLIPGTELYKQGEEASAEKGLAAAEGRESEAALKETQRKNLESEIAHREVPKEQTPEEETYKYEKEHGKTPPEAFETVKGAGKQTREGEIPLGAQVENLNKMMTDRYQVLNPGKPLPNEYTLSPKATQADFARIDKGLSATESAKGTATQRETLNEMRRQTQVLAAQKRDTTEQAIEGAAQSLAKGDLSSLKDIASMRGDQRLLIYNRVKELNPDFSTADLNRKITMLENFTNGKDGQQLQSFGTFLEHAGAAAEALGTIQQSSVPAANKPLNWWKEHLSGDPNYQAFVTSLEPVRKEFEGFLLGGRALYGDDRQVAEKLLSDDSSPSQIGAALKQMGHTVQARYNEMDHRFKGTMKKSMGEILGPLSEEAVEGATKIGVKVGSTPSGPGGAKGGAAPTPAKKSYTQADVDEAVKAHPGTTAEQIEAAFKTKGWAKK